MKDIDWSRAVEVVGAHDGDRVTGGGGVEAEQAGERGGGAGGPGGGEGERAGEGDAGGAAMLQRSNRRGQEGVEEQRLDEGGGADEALRRVRGEEAGGGGHCSGAPAGDLEGERGKTRGERDEATAR